MIWMMPDALLARQLRVSGALASRPLKEDHEMLASTTVSQLLAGWARLYGHTPVSATVTYLHLVGILVGGGVAVAADRASLRLSPEPRAVVSRPARRNAASRHQLTCRSPSWHQNMNPIRT